MDCLPFEVRSHILFWLNVTSLKALRLVCSTLSILATSRMGRLKLRLNPLAIATGRPHPSFLVEVSDVEVHRKGPLTPDCLLPVLGCLLNVTSLELVGFNFTQANLLLSNFLREMGSLEHLGLENCTFPESQMNAISSVPNVSSVTSLNLGESRWGPVLGSWQLSNLQTLNLRHNNIVNIAATDLQKLSNLTDLNLSWNPIRIDGIEKLVGCSSMQRLTRLNITYCEDLGDAGVQALARSPYLSGLTDLSMGRVGLSLEGLRVLGDATSHIQSLTSLDISGNKIRASGAELIATSPTFAKLRTLVAGSCDIGDVGVIALSHSTVTTNLTHLVLSNNDLTDASIVHLPPEPLFNKLVRLNLGFNGLHAAAIGCIAQLAIP